MPSATHHTVEIRHYRLIGLIMTLTFDLWHWNLFNNYAHWHYEYFVKSFIEIPLLSKDVALRFNVNGSPRPEGVGAHEGKGPDMVVKLPICKRATQKRNWSLANTRAHEGERVPQKWTFSMVAVIFFARFARELIPHIISCRLHCFSRSS